MGTTDDETDEQREHRALRDYILDPRVTYVDGRGRLRWRSNGAYVFVPDSGPGSPTKEESDAQLAVIAAAAAQLRAQLAAPAPAAAAPRVPWNLRAGVLRALLEMTAATDEPVDADAGEVDP